MKDLLHVAISGGGGIRRAATVLARAQVRRIPVPPVVLRMGLLVVAVPLFCLAEEFGKRCNIHSFEMGHLFASGQPCLDLLK